MPVLAPAGLPFPLRGVAPIAVVLAGSFGGAGIVGALLPLLPVLGTLHVPFELTLTIWIWYALLAFRIAVVLVARHEILRLPVCEAEGQVAVHTSRSRSSSGSDVRRGEGTCEFPRSTYMLRTDVQVRFSDTDAFGHLNNASFAHYDELARIAFLSHIPEALGAVILARLAIDFRRQVRFGEAVHVRTEVESIGRTSFGLRQSIMAGDEIAADARSVIVLFDYDAQKPKPIPAAMRAALSAHLAPPTERG